MTNMNLLRGRLGSMKMTVSAFAKEMGISRPTARRKIDGEVQFTVREMEKACEILNITFEEAPRFFLGSK